MHTRLSSRTPSGPESVSSAGNPLGHDVGRVRVLSGPVLAGAVGSSADGAANRLLGAQERAQASALQRAIGNRATGEMLRGAAESRPAAPDDGGSRLRWRAGGDLWDFNGVEHRPGDRHPTEVTLTTENDGSPGPFRWSVTGGAHRVELASGNRDAGSAVTTEGRVQVRSRPGAGGSPDTQIQVTDESRGEPGGTYTGPLGIRKPAGVRRVSSQTVTSQPATIQPVAIGSYPVEEGKEPPPGQKESEMGPSVLSAPKSMRGRGSTHNPGTPSGYLTVVNYQVLDDTGTVMSGYQVNERFPAGKVNDQPNNWPNGAAGAINVTGTDWGDRLSVEGAGSPNPQSPQSPLGTTKVYHRAQEWFVGSLTSGSGTKVQTDTIQLYLDHGEHHNIVSPVP